MTDPGLTIQDVANELRVMAHEFNKLREPLQVHFPMWRGQPLSNTLIQLAEALEETVEKEKTSGFGNESVPVAFTPPPAVFTPPLKPAEPEGFQLFQRTAVVEGEDAERIEETLKENEEKMKKKVPDMDEPNEERLEEDEEDEEE